MNAKTTARNIVAAALAATLAAGIGTVPALADECGGVDITPIEATEYALVSADQAIEIAVEAAPVSGWDEVAYTEYRFDFFHCTYCVEVWNTQGRWWMVFIDARTGEVGAVL